MSMCPPSRRSRVEAFRRLVSSDVIVSWALRYRAGGALPEDLTPDAREAICLWLIEHPRPRRTDMKLKLLAVVVLALGLCSVRAVSAQSVVLDPKGISFEPSKNHDEINPLNGVATVASYRLDCAD